MPPKKNTKEKKGKALTKGGSVNSEPASKTAYKDISSDDESDDPKNVHIPPPTKKAKIVPKPVASPSPR